MYLDPGFGGMVVQVLVALAATGGVALFAFRKKLSQLFSKNKTNSQAKSASGVSTDEIVDMLQESEQINK